MSHWVIGDSWLLVGDLLQRTANHVGASTLTWCLGANINQLGWSRITADSGSRRCRGRSVRVIVPSRLRAVSHGDAMPLSATCSIKRLIFRCESNGITLLMCRCVESHHYSYSERWRNNHQIRCQVSRDFSSSIPKRVSGERAILHMSSL